MKLTRILIAASLVALLAACSQSGPANKTTPAPAPAATAPAATAPAATSTTTAPATSSTTASAGAATESVPTKPAEEAKKG